MALWKFYIIVTTPCWVQPIGTTNHQFEQKDYYGFDLVLEASSGFEAINLFYANPLCLAKIMPLSSQYNFVIKAIPDGWEVPMNINYKQLEMF